LDPGVQKLSIHKIIKELHKKKQCGKSVFCQKFSLQVKIKIKKKRFKTPNDKGTAQLYIKFIQRVAFHYISAVH
jgi:hypothetical protein